MTGKASKARNLVLVVAWVIAAFASGWLAARIHDVNRRGLGEVTANRWMGDLGLLVDNVHSLKRVDPATTQAIVRNGLDIDSRTLAEVYDSLSPTLQKRLAFYVPMAQAIAAAQPATGLDTPDRYALRVFADCMQKAQSHGGSVGACFASRMPEAKS
jgi:hypothetical protein